MVGLFFAALANHILFTFGGVFLMLVAIVEKLRNKPTEAWIFWSAALVCLFIACYGAWVDEHHNTGTVIAEKADVWSKYNQCDKFLGSKSTLADSQASQLVQFQSQIANQQDTFNRCIMALGSMNVPQPVRVKVWDVHTPITQAVPSGEKFTVWELVVVTNRAVSPTDVLVHCDTPFNAINSSVAGAGPLMNSVFGQTSDREYEVGFTTPAWKPENPILITVAAKDESLPCNVKLKN